jgi:hypothetical protein
MRKSSFIGKFKVNDSPFTPKTASPVVKKVTEFLDKYPFGELLETRNLASILKYIPGTIHKEGASPILEDYRYKYQVKILWGSKKTIKALKKQNEH